MVFDVIPTNDQTWLICGGRNFADQAMFDGAMGDLIRMKGVPSKIIHGLANGADSMAVDWAKSYAIKAQGFQADWRMFGRAAGPMRNQRMIDNGKPHFVIAFPGGRGTADMVSRAREANIDVAEIKPKAPAQPTRV